MSKTSVSERHQEWAARLPAFDGQWSDRRNRYEKCVRTRCGWWSWSDLRRNSGETQEKSAAENVKGIDDERNRWFRRARPSPRESSSWLSLRGNRGMPSTGALIYTSSSCGRTVSNVQRPNFASKMWRWNPLFKQHRRPKNFSNLKTISETLFL